MLPILWCWKGNILNELSFLTFCRLLKIISCFIIAFSLQDKPPCNEPHFLVLIRCVVPPLTQSWLTPGTKKYYGSDSVLFPRLSHRRHHHFCFPFSESLVLGKPAAMLEGCSSSAAVRKGIEDFHWQPSSTWQSQERDTLEAATPAPGKPSDGCSPGWHWQVISWETLNQNCQVTDFLTCRSY